MMMEYCAHVMSNFAIRLRERSFDQDDVALFILMARDYCRKGSALRELGDFLAHPAARDRGLVFSAIDSVAPQFEALVLREIEAQEFQVPNFKFQSLDKAAIVQDVCGALDQAGIHSNIQISDQAIEELIACVILLIQHCGIQVKGRRAVFELEYGHGLHLYVLYESERFPSHRGLFMVLSVGNINRSLFSPSRKIDRHIARRIPDGRLAGFPYASDTSRIDGHADQFDLAHALLLTP